MVHVKIFAEVRHSWINFPLPPKALARYPRTFNPPVYFGALQEMRTALLSATTLTSCGDCELIATPVAPGVANAELLGVALAVGVALFGVGLAEGVATAPATTLNRGVDGKPEPRDE